MSDEQRIRELIGRWAIAVHVGDLPSVLADHAPDIVMFDVPPPERGVRGLDAYRQTWPGFFQWQALQRSVTRSTGREVPAKPSMGLSLPPCWEAVARSSLDTEVD